MESLPKSGTKRKAISQRLEVTTPEQAVEEEALATKTSTAASQEKSPLSSSGNVKKGAEAGEHSSNPSVGFLTRDCIADAAAKVGPAVVSLFYQTEDTLETISYSGTIIDADGTILTSVMNEQLLTMPAIVNKKVEVTLQDGQYFEGTVVLADVPSDVAIVKIKSELPLPVAKLDSSCKLRPGDWVISLGCLCELPNSVTIGTVSCIDRRSIDLQLEGIYREYLQINCTVNRGNSGGPLVNIDGEIVRLNTIKFIETAGMHFAVPSDSVLKIVDAFKKNGKIVRSWIGLETLDLNEMTIAKLKKRYSNFPEVKQGIRVTEVTGDSPADIAGLLSRDIITRLNGKAVKSTKEIVEMMEAGKSLEVHVIRGHVSISKLLTVIPKEIDMELYPGFCASHI